MNAEDRIKELEKAVLALEGAVERRTKERDRLLRAAQQAACYLLDLKRSLNLNLRGYEVLDDELNPAIDAVAGTRK